MLIIFLAKYLILSFYLVIGFMLVSKEYRSSLLAIGAGVVVLLTKVLLGLFVFVPRPFIVNPGLPYYRQAGGIFFTPSDSSFFSVHAAGTFALATVIYLTYQRKLGLVLFAAAALVSLGRVLANVHYPIDVFFGAGIGIWVGVVVVLVGSPRNQNNYGSG